MLKIGKELDQVLLLQARFGTGRDGGDASIPVPRDSSRPASPYPQLPTPEKKRARKKSKRS